MYTIDPALLRRVLCVSMLLSTVTVTSTAHAQQLDFDITAPAAELLTHDNTNSVQTFPEGVWRVDNSIVLLGATAYWTCGPFEHEFEPNLKADAKLNLRVIQSFPLAVWLPLITNDNTDIQSGNETAMVAARSLLLGDANIGVTVRCIETDRAKLAAGNYNLTLTGTITAN